MMTHSRLPNVPTRWHGYGVRSTSCSGQTIFPGKILLKYGHVCLQIHLDDMGHWKCRYCAKRRRHEGCKWSVWRVFFSQTGDSLHHPSVHKRWWRRIRTPPRHRRHNDSQLLPPTTTWPISFVEGEEGSLTCPTWRKTPPSLCTSWTNCLPPAKRWSLPCLTFPRRKQSFCKQGQVGFHCWCGSVTVILKSERGRRHERTSPQNGNNCAR